MILSLQIALSVISLAMTMLVLLHRGRGGGLSDLFGGGVSTGLGGSSVAERNLDRITVAMAIIWLALIFSLLFLTKIS
jgi:preprotein translocase subunit SecG